jgi:hypothetical protein
MPRIYSPAGEQLAWIGEAIGDDVETYDVIDVPAYVERVGSVERIPNEETILRYTRAGRTWELVAREVTDE